MDQKKVIYLAESIYLLEYNILLFHRTDPTVQNTSEDEVNLTNGNGNLMMKGEQGWPMAIAGWQK